MSKIMTSYDVTYTPKTRHYKLSSLCFTIKLHIRPDCVVNVIKNKSFNEVKNLNFQVLRKTMGPVDKKPITADIILTET